MDLPLLFVPCELAGEGNAFAFAEGGDRLGIVFSVGVTGVELEGFPFKASMVARAISSFLRRSFSFSFRVLTQDC